MTHNSQQLFVDIVSQDPELRGQAIHDLLATDDYDLQEEWVSTIMAKLVHADCETQVDVLQDITYLIDFSLIQLLINFLKSPTRKYGHWSLLCCTTRVLMKKTCIT